MNKYIIYFILTSVLSCFAKDFKGAEYRTKESFLYGRIEARYKPPYKDGVLGSLFTYYDGSGYWNEIDVEILGRYDNDVQFNTITPGQFNHVRHQCTNFNPCADFHTYAIEWTPDYVAWFIDGQEACRQTGEHIATLTKAQKIMMNIWNPAAADWAGQWTADSYPAFAYYDFVSYYSYTPGKGSYGSGNNFTFLWKDDLDSFDSNRWAMATHTFAGNNCDFTPSNIVFKDGKMILCLTDNANAGYKDIKPPAIQSAWGREGKVTVKFSEELNKTSAENLANYKVYGLTVTQATLMADSQSVELGVPDMDMTKSYAMNAAYIKDKFNNEMSSKTVLVNMPKLTFPVKINIGGGSVNGYQAEQAWGQSAEHGYIDGTAASLAWTPQINNSDEDIIYKTERYGLSSYKIRVPDGTYNVKLMMAETYWNQPAKRVFDVFVQGNKVSENLDLFSAAGLNTSCDLTVKGVVASDGFIRINMGAETDYSLLNGLVIEKASTGVETGNNRAPKGYMLGQNYPNPFNPSTTIGYEIPVPGNVQIKLYDILGKDVATLTDGYKTAGKHELRFAASENTLAGGIYYYRLIAESYSETRKLVLLK